ncbi:sugar-binding transcriptional regulator [Limosilactobacillus reuteri]|uniref:sugar-binding transcriptional regulator n=1 Tax=Limosilactobacillus reuteri TaxID=1598 RepID=UPI001E4122CE|nr:sugar-binding transcriptional regulator [Limosilactobacillus reuteri]MCC4502593.1 sugar-binding transcriptional regulator [Limosilactobacillus reuteri]
MALSNKKAVQIKAAVTVSRLYYIDKISQTAIAKKLKMSRPTISRLLQLAQDNNIVQITINNPFEEVSDLPAQLAAKYGLKKVLIADQVGDSYESILNQIGQIAARYLGSIVRDNDTIGLTWGNTMAVIARFLQPSTKKNVHTVYLKGTVSNSTHNNYSNIITQHFNANFHTQTEILPVPVIFDHQKTRDLVLQDQFIKRIIQQGKAAEIALFTVGTTRPDAMLFQLGYFTNQQTRYLEQHAVGDILSQFITKNGQIAAPEIAKRTISLPLDNLKKKRESILVAGGMEKVPAIHAALRGEYANVLITDLKDAERLFAME